MQYKSALPARFQNNTAFVLLPQQNDWGWLQNSAFTQGHPRMEVSSAPQGSSVGLSATHFPLYNCITYYHVLSGKELRSGSEALANRWQPVVMMTSSLTTSAVQRQCWCLESSKDKSWQSFLREFQAYAHNAKFPSQANPPQVIKKVQHPYKLQDS